MSTAVERMKAIRISRRAAGLCVRCGKPSEGMYYCAKDRRKSTRGVQNWRNKIRAQRRVRHAVTMQ